MVDRTPRMVIQVTPDTHAAAVRLAADASARTGRKVTISEMVSLAVQSKGNEGHLNMDQASIASLLAQAIKAFVPHGQMDSIAFHPDSKVTVNLTNGAVADLWGIDLDRFVDASGQRA